MTDIEQPEPDEETQVVIGTNLTFQQQAAARFKVSGRSNAWIAEYVGVTTATLSRWWRNETMAAELERLSAQINIEYVNRTVEVGLKALSVLEEMLDMPLSDDTISLADKRRVATEVLDRHSSSSKVRDRTVTTGGDVTSDNPFAGMSSDALLGSLAVAAQQFLPPGLDPAAVQKTAQNEKDRAKS